MDREVGGRAGFREQKQERLRRSTGRFDVFWPLGAENDEWEDGEW